MDICLTNFHSVEEFNNECRQLYREIVYEGHRNLSFPQFLNFFQIDFQRFAIPLEFWFTLNKMRNDQFFHFNK